MKVEVVLLLVCTCLALSAGADYDYAEAVSKSLLFYEAQRAGELPTSNRVPWRLSSMLQDIDGAVDLTGGYFDAGDYVKFNFPISWAIRTLAWGGIDFGAGYTLSGQTEYILDAVRWGTDYFMKCHPSDNELYVHVGDAEADHTSWDLPQRWTGERPAYKLTTSAPGSDAAGETAAALAAASILFRPSDATYSARLLSHARTTYNFAKNYRGKYSDSVPAATPFYTSYGYMDELAWAAAWLHRATNESVYLSDAKSFYAEANLQWNSGFSWDNKASGVDALLARATDESIYVNSLTAFCDHAIWSTPRTPKGLVFFSEWGSLRSASNAIFICLQMLGDGGRSYQVGFGMNPPTHSHHRSSSCPNPPEECGWSFFNNASLANTNQVVGALVGGPGIDDDYVDKRDDAVKNEVAMDYNAAFQGALAGLLSI